VRGPWTVGVAIGPGVALVLDLTLVEAGPVHAVLVSLASLLAGAIGLRVTGDIQLGAMSAVALSLWRPMYGAPDAILMTSLGVGLVAAAPPIRPALLPVIAGVLAGICGFVAFRDPLAAAAAATVGLLVAAGRPAAPTREQIAWLRTGSLALPTIGLVAVYGINLASPLDVGQTVRGAIEVGVGVFGLLALMALSGLGLATLIESTSPHQGNAWAASAAWVGLVAGSVVLRDASGALAAVAAGGAVVMPLAFVAAKRTAAGSGPWHAVVLVLPFLPIALQFALGSL
jgi:hypothetical protein